MHYIRQLLWSSCLSLGLIASSMAEESMMIDKFDAQPELRWKYFSDQVMGGVSQGRAEFEAEQGAPVVRLSGQVSTANNGGFIQIRRDIAKGSVDSATGVYLTVRGNGQLYYLHLRTSRSLMPWQYYQASFQTSEQWQTIQLPLSAFERSNSWLSKFPKASSLRNLGIVAFGRDHIADLEIAEIGFY
jgi:hypothetical protein